MRDRAPRLVGFFNPLVRRLLGAGIPLGPNALLTIRGRRSGLPRTVPVAVVEDRARRWVLGTFGEVNWVRNLRAAGEAELAVDGQRLAVAARELPAAEAVEVLRRVVLPYAGRLPLARWLLRNLLGAGELFDDPEAFAARRPIFELHRVPSAVPAAISRG